MKKINKKIHGMIVLGFILLIGIQMVSADVGINSCRNLDVEGETYYLTEDIPTGDKLLTACLIFKESGITLDCQGHSIKARALGYYTPMILLQDSTKNIQNIKIKNCVLEPVWDKRTGIKLVNTKYVEVINNTIKNCFTGMMITNVDYSNFTNNTDSGSRTAFRLDYVDHTKFENNSVTNNGWGFYLYSRSSDNLIINNIINDASSRGVYVGDNSIRNNFTRNIITNSPVTFWNSNQNILDNNKICSASILCSSSSGTIFTDNQCASSSCGSCAASCSDCVSDAECVGGAGTFCSVSDEFYECVEGTKIYNEGCYYKNLIEDCSLSGLNCDPISGCVTSVEEISACQRLDEAGKSYKLTRDLSGEDIVNTGNGCITINADEITLDCDYNSITHPGKGYAGIYSNSDDVTIKNCEVNMGTSLYAAGIQLYSAENNDLIENTLTGNYLGIYLDASNSNNLADNIAQGNTYGFFILSGTNNIFSNNNFCDNTILCMVAQTFGTTNFCIDDGDCGGSCLSC